MLLSRALHLFAFHRRMSLFACGNGFHRFVDRRQCILAGQFRFFDVGLRLFVVVRRRIEHVPKHRRQLRRVPWFAFLTFPLDVVTNFRVLFECERQVPKGAVRVGVNHDVAPGSYGVDAATVEFPPARGKRLFAEARILDSLEASKKLIHLKFEDLVSLESHAEFVELDSPVRWIIDGRSVDERMLCLLKQSDRSPDIGQLVLHIAVPAHDCHLPFWI